MKDEDLPLVTNRHRNRAMKDLGKVYRVKTDPPNEYPEIGAVEATMATELLATAYATIEHLKKKYEHD